ncbi:MAG: hypothetical protein RLZZ297_147 [Chloroflexota bacterium]|jgi:hypothetical protein
MKTEIYDIVIVGGGLSAVAAALQAAADGCSVLLLADERWLGGQASSQGVSALDEHRYIETYGTNRLYAQFRSAIRQQMAAQYGIVSPAPTYNPGNAWVSGLCYLPSVAHEVLTDMLTTTFAAARRPCTVVSETVLCGVDRLPAQISAVAWRDAAGREHRTVADIVIDASELGDVLTHGAFTHVTGAESRADTGEALAPLVAAPHEVQSFTYGFAVEYLPGESHRIAKPAGYEALRDRQPFTLTLHGDDGNPRPFRVFCDGPTGLPPFWTYRRLLDGSQCTPSRPDIALINWNSNDYHDGSILVGTPAERAHHRDAAKRLSLAFLYWMQTEMPRDDGGCGYPELRLRPDVMGTSDGLSMAPYIRESCRTPGLVRVIAEDILETSNPGPRARLFADSVGIGWYPLDLHPAPGNPTSRFLPTRPFQIPLGALIPPDCVNLVLANKNIATTHLSNGAYRLHPVEWAIGIAAGAVAAAARTTGQRPAEIWGDTSARRQLQRHLLAVGQPLVWVLGVDAAEPILPHLQELFLAGALDAPSPYAESLTVDLDETISAAQHAALQRAWDACVIGHPYPLRLTLRELCRAFSAAR